MFAGSRATPKDGKTRRAAAVREAAQMSDANPSIIETRRDQIFPHLDATDIERAWRFGELRRFAVGEALAAIGEVGVGLAITLSGRVDLYRHDSHGNRQHVYRSEERRVGKECTTWCRSRRSPYQ